MSELPPPSIEPQPVPNQTTFRDRWRGTPRWKRWTAYGAADPRLAHPSPAQIDRVGCAVVAGDWFSTDDGLTWSDVDEPRTLRVVTGDVNGAKGSNDPVNWLPPDESAVCQYLADWVSITARWGLAMDESEHGRVRNLLRDRCPDQFVAPWVEVPPAVLTEPVDPRPIAPTAPAAPPAAPTPGTSSCDPAYPGRVHRSGTTRPRLRRHPLPSIPGATA